MSVSAAVTNISRCSLHDGPGIRTVVYLKGCGLRCQWCHNPETLSARVEILYAPVKCIHCGRCITLCPEHHQIQGNDMVYLRDGCIRCGKCADGCPSGALNLCGEDMTAQQVFAQVVKDQHYYLSSGGGVTLSGGECLLHPDFSAELLRLCRQEGIHTVIETALYVPWDHVEKVLPFIDLIYADLKLADSKKHRAYTGQDNVLILENMDRLSRLSTPMVLRIPLIPGVNDSVSDMADFARVISSLGEAVREVELLRYNNLAESKYQISGRTYHSFGNEPQSFEKMDELKAALQAGLPERICVSYRK